MQVIVPLLLVVIAIGLSMAAYYVATNQMQSTTGASTGVEESIHRALISIYMENIRPPFITLRATGETNEIDPKYFTLLIDDEVVRYTLYKIGNGTYTLVFDKCLSQGPHTFTIRYYGDLKDMQTYFVGKYVV